MAEGDPGTDASGHRERLRARMFEGGPEALLDHELVEYLLTLSIRRQDTKPIARRLLAEFGGIGPLLTADRDSLAKQGLGDTTIAVLKVAHHAAMRLLKSAVQDRPVLGSWQALIDYLHVAMAHRLNESARVLHLNTKNVLIRDEQVSEGSIDQAAIYVREVARRALELGSVAVILVHNHPSGDATPSRQDIQLTREMAGALRPLGVTVHDHLIIGANGHTSLRSLGLV